MKFQISTERIPNERDTREGENMNHWFLVGRDVMWFLVAAFPPFLFFLAGERAKQDEEASGFFFFSGASVYVALLVCLYGGLIK